tara:strand:+ start:128 stop:715 length:588 start_codon:yes stop_codon:yes gene_type:complete
VKIKSVFLKIFKWLLIIIVGGAGWIALLIFVIVWGFSEGGSRLGLPIGQIDSEEFWSYGYQGDIPKILREKSNVIVYSRYGFTDVVSIGLIKLNDKDKDRLLTSTFENSEIEADYNLFSEKVLCLGSADLALSWSIQDGSVLDYFEFCKNLGNEKTIEWRSVRLQKNQDNGVVSSSLDISHLVGTNYFTIYHGQY